jgi:hypothetical protein
MNVSYAKEHGNGAAERQYGTPPTEKIIEKTKQLQNGYRKANIIRVLQNGQRYHEEKAAEQVAEKKTEFPCLQKNDHN